MRVYAAEAHRRSAIVPIADNGDEVKLTRFRGRLLV
jgi:hypothetical protein